MTFVSITLAAALAGVVIGRWLALPIAVGTWVGFMLGLKADWWGNGVGDAWTVSLFAGAGLVGLGASLGVLGHRAVTAWQGSRTRRPTTNRIG